MNKKALTYIVAGIVVMIGVYIYVGMFLAEEKSLMPELTNDPVSNETEANTRLRNAGAMSEEERLEMQNRLEDGEVMSEEERLEMESRIKSL